MLHLILKSCTDEGFGRNVYKLGFFLSTYIYKYIVNGLYIYVLEEEGQHLQRAGINWVFCPFYFVFQC